MRWWKRRRRWRDSAQETSRSIAAAQRMRADADRKDGAVRAAVDRMAEIREVNGLARLFEAALGERRR